VNRAARLARIALAVGLAACGYRPLHGAVPEGERLAVAAAPAVDVDAAVLAEVEAGVRSALSRAGALRGGGGWPRVVVEVLRVDASGEGIALSAGAPRARATRAAVVARAWVERAPGAPRERDTGDLRASDVSAVAESAAAELLADASARAAVARRLGERLGRRVAGEPDAPDDVP
jgi:hypothetical protein